MTNRSYLVQWKNHSGWLVPGVVMLAILAAVLSGRWCAYLGTDFRGYYAAAQIAWQEGFGQVYDQGLQSSYQAELAHTCPNSTTAPALLFVSMPYLPAYVLIFLPLPLLDFTSSYYLWGAVNLIVLFFYLVRFTKGVGIHSNLKVHVQWLTCLPVLANLGLGQMNVFLVICLGEFILAGLKSRDRASGFWLAAMLIKPHLLILLLPGLAFARKWKTLASFSAGAATILVVSVLLAGVQGVFDSIRMAVRFAGPLIQTGPTMTNWRALALNLELLLPSWAAWILAGCGAAITAAAILSLWQAHKSPSPEQFLLLVTAATAGAITISWHAHFYLLMLMMPIFIVLDLKNKLPKNLLLVWIAGPPAVYAAAFVLHPEMARNLVGLAYLGFNLGLIGWIFWKLKPKRFFVGAGQA